MQEDRIHGCKLPLVVFGRGGYTRRDEEQPADDVDTDLPIIFTFEEIDADGGNTTNQTDES